jgi:hypothetical protein
MHGGGNLRCGVGRAYLGALADKDEHIGVFEAIDERVQICCASRECLVKWEWQVQVEEH